MGGGGGDTSTPLGESLVKASMLQSSVSPRAQNKERGTIEKTTTSKGIMQSNDHITENWATIEGGSTPLPSFGGITAQRTLSRSRLKLGILPLVASLFISTAYFAGAGVLAVLCRCL